MDFGLTEEQRSWQMKAREFALEVLRPRSLERDRIEGGHAPWDWDIIKAGSQLGFRTVAVPKEWGGPQTDFVTQGLVMAELARGDSAMSKAFSQNWKWSHLTEALRSYVMRTGWEMDHKLQGANAVLVMNYSTTVIQRVTELNLSIHAAAGPYIDAMAEKLVRDGIIWTHLAGDASQRLKAVRRFR